MTTTLWDNIPKTVPGGLNGGTPAPDGIIDGKDFIAFINAFAAGC